MNILQALRNTSVKMKEYVDKHILRLESGDVIVKESEHSSTADAATNADNAVNAENAKEAEHAVNADNANHATNADHATTADSSTKAEQDGNGNVITDTYETKADASAKLSEAKSYTDTAVANLVNSAPETLDTLGELATAFEENAEVVEALNAAITNKADKSEIPTNIVQYVEQELTEEQQMQTRKNLGLYNKYEQLILETLYTNMYWGNEWYPEDATDNLTSVFEIGKEYIVSLGTNEYKVISRQYNDDRHMVDSVYSIRWIGNANLIEQDYLPYRDEYTGVPFVIYWEDADGDGENFNWDEHPNIITSPDTPIVKYDEITVSTIMGGETVCEKIQEEYIPDTIARKSDIPEIPEHTWESLPDKPFYSNKTTLLEINEPTITFKEGSSGLREVNLSVDTTVLPDDKEFSYVLKINDEKVQTGTVVYMGYFDISPSFSNSSYMIGGFGRNTEINIKIWNPDLAEDTEVSLALEFYDGDLKQIEEEFIPNTIARLSDIPEIPTDTLVYTEQSLEESEKMQARSNLGLYYSHEVPNKSLVFDYVNNTINIDTLTLTEGFDVNGDYIVIALGNEYNLSSKCFERNDLSVGRVSGIKWIGNPHLIDNSVYAEELANETENTDLEFVIYWSVDAGTGYWCNPTVVFDSSLPEWLLETEPLYIYKEEGFRTEYETIPEEFIPDTIARDDEVLTKTNTVEYTPTSDYHPATKLYVDSLIPSEMDALALVTEVGFVDPVENNGYIFVDANGNIYTF